MVGPLDPECSLGTQYAGIISLTKLRKAPKVQRLWRWLWFIDYDFGIIWSLLLSFSASTAICSNMRSWFFNTNTYQVPIECYTQQTSYHCWISSKVLWWSKSSKAISHTSWSPCWMLPRYPLTLSEPRVDSTATMILIHTYSVGQNLRQLEILYALISLDIDMTGN